MQQEQRPGGTHHVYQGRRQGGRQAEVAGQVAGGGRVEQQRDARLAAVGQVVGRLRDEPQVGGGRAKIIVIDQRHQRVYQRQPAQQPRARLPARL